MKKYLVTALLLCVGSTANAALVASDSTTIISTGQSYAQSFVVTPSAFSNAVLTLDVFGDFGQTQKNEHFKFYIDGQLLADLHANSHDGFTAITDDSCCSWHFTGDVSIDNALWSLFDSDGQLDVSWRNGAGVNVIASSNYVNWSINAAPVPVPGAVWLFCSGLIGFLGMRKNRLRACSLSV